MRSRTPWMGLAAVMAFAPAPTAGAALPCPGPVFDRAQAPALSVERGPTDAMLVDFTGDGTLDLAVVNFESDSLSFFQGHGGGSFEPASLARDDIEALFGPIAAGDVNGDGTADLAIASVTSQTVTLFLSDARGSLVAEPPIDVGYSPTASPSRTSTATPH